ILLTLFALLSPPPPRSTLFPYTTLFRSILADIEGVPPGKTERMQHAIGAGHVLLLVAEQREVGTGLRSKALVLAQRVDAGHEIRSKSTRLNSSHVKISYAVFCLKKKKIK